MSQPHQIISADADQEVAAIGALVSGFIADPMMRWMYPAPAAYLDAFPRLLQLMTPLAVAERSLFVEAGGLGSALWLPPGIAVDQEAEVELVVATMEPSRLPDMLSMARQFESYHEAAGHCWYLAFVGVDAGAQGRGLGSALLKHALAVVDASGLPAYLEATSPGNRALYQRHGFEDMGAIQAGDSPALMAMLRPPRAR